MFLAGVLSALTALPTLFSDLAALFTAIANLFHTEQGNTVAQAARAAVQAAEQTYQPLVASVGITQDHANTLKREFAVNAVKGLHDTVVPEHQARVAVEMAVAEAKQSAAKAAPAPAAG